MQNTKEHTKIVREKHKQRKRFKKHYEKRKTKVDEKAMCDLLNIAKAILYS